MPDTLFKDRYRLDAKIGEGGTSVVYRGYDLLLRRQVAIKVLRAQHAADEQFARRFLDEARAAANLSHPNIVNTYDVGDVDGSHFIVQEYVGGETLDALVRRQGKLPEAVAVRYARQICAALAVAHRAGMVHADIKPSNLLVTPDDNIRVADFGVTRALSAQPLEDTESVLASVPYCSPEHVNNRELTEASDLYSLGVVIFEMVTGRRPYVADTALATAIAHLQRPVPDPIDAGADIGPQLRDVIVRLMAKAPRDRYRTAGETDAALRDALRADEHDESVPSAAAADDAPRRRRRRDSAADVPAPAPAFGAPPAWHTRRMAIVAFSAFAFVIVVAMVVAAEQAASHALRVPALAGRSVVEGVALLRVAGIQRLAMRQRTDPTVQAGLLVGTEPAAQTPVQPDSTVTLVISSGPPTQALPDVVGKDPKTAIALLTSQGFNVRLGTPRHSRTVKNGLVAATNPMPGVPVPVKSTVVVFTSSGPVTTSVPNIVALSVDDARRTLASVGLKLKINQTIPSADIPARVVIDQEPVGGATLEPGAVVIVDLSGGPANIIVPDLIGSTVGDARATLARSGLGVGNIATATGVAGQPGTVVSQDPPPNAQLPQGAAVNLVVVAGQGQQPPPGQPSPNLMAPIPDVIGMTVDQARATLAKAGYRVNHVTLPPGTPPNANVVVGTEPEPGATTPPGTVDVDLIVGVKP